MKKKQIATMAASLGLVAALGVGATLAILSSQSNVVTNTFAAGNGINPKEDITLFEHDPYNSKGGDQDKYRDGTLTGEKWIDINGVSYRGLEPNSTLDKDPAVQISQGTADCYLFVKVTNGLTDVYDISIDGIFDEKAGNSNWKLLTGTTDVYYYVENGADASKGTVIDTSENMFVSEPLFNKITLGKDAEIYNPETGENILTSDNNIVVKALVVQATQTDNWDQAIQLAKAESSWE